jgi:hypothetical protein
MGVIRRQEQLRGTGRVAMEVNHGRTHPAAQYEKTIASRRGHQGWFEAGERIEGGLQNLSQQTHEASEEASKSSDNAARER